MAASWRSSPSTAPRWTTRKRKSARARLAHAHRRWRCGRRWSMQCPTLVRTVDRPGARVGVGLRDRGTRLPRRNPGRIHRALRGGRCRHSHHQYEQRVPRSHHGSVLSGSRELVSASGGCQPGAFAGLPTSSGGCRAGRESADVGMTSRSACAPLDAIMRRRSTTTIRRGHSLERRIPLEPRTD